jgi:hypothetical protein
LQRGRCALSYIHPNAPRHGPPTSSPVQVNLGSSRAGSFTVEFPANRVRGATTSGSVERSIANIAAFCQRRGLSHGWHHVESAAALPGAETPFAGYSRSSAPKKAALISKGLQRSGNIFCSPIVCSPHLYNVNDLRNLLPLNTFPPTLFSLPASRIYERP